MQSFSVYIVSNSFQCITTFDATSISFILFELTGKQEVRVYKNEASMFYRIFWLGKKNWNWFLFKYLFKIKDGAFRFHKVLLRAFFRAFNDTLEFIEMRKLRKRWWTTRWREKRHRKDKVTENGSLDTPESNCGKIMLIVFPWTKPSPIRFAKLFSVFFYFSRLNLNKCIAMGFFPFQVIKCFSGDRDVYSKLFKWINK